MKLRVLGFGFLVLGSLLSIGGCGSGSKEAVNEKTSAKAAPPADEKEPEFTDNAINVGKGNSTDLKEGTREPLWLIDWEKATVDPKTKVLQGTNIKGTVMRDRKEVADYKGDSAFADKASEKLMLKGQVQVKSRSYNATLYCDTLLYDGKSGKDGRIIARGNVKVVGEGGNMSSQSEVWATPDLTKVGTPEVFGKL